jgi:anti-sigma factor RsiW
MTPDTNLHPGEETLEKYSLGHLSESDVERVEEHLLICHRCQDELTAVEAYIREVKEACKDLGKEPAPLRAGLFSRWLAAVPMPAMATAGALAVLLLMVGIPILRQPGATTGSTVAVELSAMRGGENGGIAAAGAGHPLELLVDAAQLPAAHSYRAEIVDARGSQIWSGSPVREATRMVLKVSRPLPAGTYWVRMYGADRDPLREFGLQVR